MNILVVDDEDMIRETLVAFLEAKGCNVVGAATAEEALDLLEKTPADAAVVDIRLPGMDGNQFILKANACHPDMKFLIYTGSSEYAPPKELARIGIGAGDILRKPLSDLTELLKALRRREGKKNSR